MQHSTDFAAQRIEDNAATSASASFRCSSRGNFPSFSCLLASLCQSSQLRCGSTCPKLLSLASYRRPPPSLRSSPRPSCPPPDYTPSSPPNLHPAQPDHKNSVLHPRVAVLLGVERHWHVPLLLCRGLSTAPAAWWGLRCALTFMGELLLDESKEEIGATWSVERRFRVTEVFLAVLWVCSADKSKWPLW